jgi:hypothetical protein
MTALTVNHLVDAGTKPTFQNSSASDTADYGNGKNSFLVYKNTGGSNSVVTINVPGNNVYGQPYPDPAITVLATSGEMWIPLRKEEDDGNGTNTVTVTATNSGATLQVALVRVDWA